MATLAKMISMSATRHEGQHDKGGNAYILHPLKVMHYTRSDDEEIMQIAVGHDLVEDTDITLEYLESLGFSDRVVDGIDAMTKRVNETKEQYIERLMLNNDAVIVKMADVRHNSDIRRLKGLSAKDFKRMEWYQTLYTKLKEHRLKKGF